MKSTLAFIIFISLSFSLFSCDEDKSEENNVNNLNNTTNTNNSNSNSNNINNGYCGDGLILGVEECDDNNMQSGDGCSSECLWEYECGDGVMEFSEQCDGEDYNYNTCVLLGFLQGDLQCNDCILDTSGCTDDSSGLSIAGWYKLDSVSGQEPNSAGENNLCIVHSLGEGAIIRDYPGRIGSSIFFDGSFGLRGFTDCGPGYSGMDAITVEAWVEVGTYPLDLSMLISNVSSHDASGLGFYLGINGDFKLEAAVGDWENVISSNANIITRQWHHVAFTYDGSELALFVDGMLDNSVGHAVGPVPQLDVGISRVYMANNYIDGMAETDHFYTGTLDEVKIWTTVRSEAEICLDAGGVFVIETEFCEFIEE